MRDTSLSGRQLGHSVCVMAALLPFSFFDGARADEVGVSFWLQGQVRSFAAVPSNPGWSFESTSYHATASADASRNSALGGGIQARMKSPSDFVMVTPTYVFATPIGRTSRRGNDGFVPVTTTSLMRWPAPRCWRALTSLAWINGSPMGGPSSHERGAPCARARALSPRLMGANILAASGRCKPLGL